MKKKLGVNFDIYDDEYIANNLLKVDIFYRQLSYKEIIEKPGYEVCQVHILYELLHKSIQPVVLAIVLAI